MFTYYYWLRVGLQPFWLYIQPKSLAIEDRASFGKKQFRNCCYGSDLKAVPVSVPTVSTGTILHTLSARHLAKTDFFRFPTLA